LYFIVTIVHRVLSGSQSQYKTFWDVLRTTEKTSKVYIINSLKFVCNKMLLQVVGVVAALGAYFPELYILDEFLRLLWPVAGVLLAEGLGSEAQLSHRV